MTSNLGLSTDLGPIRLLLAPTAARVTARCTRRLWRPSRRPPALRWRRRCRPSPPGAWGTRRRRCRSGAAPCRARRPRRTGRAPSSASPPRWSARPTRPSSPSDATAGGRPASPRSTAPRWTRCRENTQITQMNSPQIKYPEYSTQMNSLQRKHPEHPDELAAEKTPWAPRWTRSRENTQSTKMNSLQRKIQRWAPDELYYGCSNGSRIRRVIWSTYFVNKPGRSYSIFTIMHLLASGMPVHDQSVVAVVRSHWI